MCQKLYILLILTVCSDIVSAQNNEPGVSDISLLFIGDVMGHDEQIWSAENRETHRYNYDGVFKYIVNEISEADIAIANFEVTLGGTPYTGYPAFSSPAALASACAGAGIDFLMTANNHSADRGRRGILSTIARLDSLGIPHTGTFTGKAQRDSVYPFILEKNGFRLAMLNYTYGTNGIRVQPPELVNMLDKTLVGADIEKAKAMDPDAVILFLHWGTEYDTIPSAGQTAMAEYFLSKGADLVIGSHPHVLQKMVWSKGDPSKPDGIDVYSLGNFVSNQRRTGTDGGAMVRIELEKRGDSTYIRNAGYYLTWVWTPIENYRKHFFILPCSKFETNSGFFTNPADYRKMMLFVRNSRRLFSRQNISISEFVHSGSSWTYYQE